MFKGSEFTIVNTLFFFINKTLISNQKKKNSIFIVTLFKLCLKDFEIAAWAYIIETYDLVKNHKI